MQYRVWLAKNRHLPPSWRSWRSRRSPRWGPGVVVIVAPATTYVDRVRPPGRPENRKRLCRAPRPWKRKAPLPPPPPSSSSSTRTTCTTTTGTGRVIHRDNTWLIIINNNYSKNLCVFLLSPAAVAVHVDDETDITSARQHKDRHVDGHGTSVAPIIAIVN